MFSPHDGQDLSSEQREAGGVSQVVTCRLVPGPPLPSRLRFKFDRRALPQRNANNKPQTSNQKPDSPAWKHAAYRCIG